jgi:hypothetical protein
MLEQRCLEHADLTALLAGDLTAHRREEIERHLSRCRHCRQQLVFLYKGSQPDIVAAHAPRWLKASVLRLPKKRWVPIPILVFGYRRQIAGVAASMLVIAGVALLFQGTSLEWSQAPPTDIFRQEERTSTSIQLITPDADTIITSDEIEFRWSEVPDTRSYALILLNEKGDIIFQTSTTQNHLTLNIAQLSLVRGMAYFWYVEAKLLDGAKVDSEVRRLALK